MNDSLRYRSRKGRKKSRRVRGGTLPGANGIRPDERGAAQAFHGSFHWPGMAKG